jgi:serralysin
MRYSNGSTVLAGYASIQAADETGSVTLTNAGTIGGNVILFLGSDQFDARAGTVGGTVYGLADADTITLGAFAGSATLTLGGGQDMLVFSGYTPGGALVVTDFLAGNGGDRLSWTGFLQSWLTGWDGVSNPFAPGYLALSQSGTDTLVRIDCDSAAGSEGFATLLTLKEVSMFSLTASNLDGLAPPHAGITGTEGDDYIEGTEGNDLIEGLGGNDELQGYGGDDRLEGGEGADYLEGGNGSDLLYGGAGNDGLLDFGGVAADAQLYGEDGNDDLLVSLASGTVARSVLLDGGNDNDSLTFLAGSRFIDQATLIGGAGNDYIYTRGGLNVAIDAGTGADRVELGHGATNYTVTLGTGADLLTIIYYNVAPALPNVVATDFETGDAGDRLEYLTAYFDLALTNWDHATNPFATGHVQLVQSGADAILQIDRDGAGSANGFVNLVTFQNVSAAALTTFNLGHVPPDGSKPAGLTITSTSLAETIHGTLGDDVLRGATYETFGFDYGGDYIYGYGGDDDLAGGTGGDRLYGGVGNDIYHVEDPTDLIFEAAGAGNDRVIASVDFGLSGDAEVETLEAIGGTAAIDLTGNYLAQTLIGNAGDNVLHGGGGSDTLRGLGGNDTYYADVASVQVQETDGGGTDRLFVSVSYALAGGSEIEVLSTNNHAATAAINLTGNSFNQTLIGNAGENILHGGGGTDLLIGLGGRDIYYIDVASTQIVEYEGGGNDALYVSTSYVLVNGEVEVLSTNNHASTQAINLTGNLYAQTLIGNAGNNVLNGGGGTDLLIGLAGNDTFYVDVAAVQIVEYEGGGNDTLYASTSYVLVNGEVETLSVNDYGSTQALNLTGDLYAQTLIGNAGANVLNGGGGVDSLIGLGGNDTYYVDVAGTQAYEAAGAGADAIYTSVSYALAAGNEVETLSSNDYGATTSINLAGNASAQALTGNAGANRLDGGGGADTLFGLGGADNFAFTTALGGGNVDAIADFSVADDTIQLDDAIFAAIGAPGALGANAFHTSAAAHDADDRIVYNSATGQLFYDADGTGGDAAVQFATLASGLSLTASDFQVI